MPAAKSFNSNATSSMITVVPVSRTAPTAGNVPLRTFQSAAARALDENDDSDDDEHMQQVAITTSSTSSSSTSSSSTTNNQQKIDSIIDLFRSGDITKEEMMKMMADV